MQSTPRGEAPPARRRVRADRGAGQRARPRHRRRPASSPLLQATTHSAADAAPPAPRPTPSPRKTRRGCARCGSRRSTASNRHRPSPRRHRIHSQIDRRLHQQQRPAPSLHGRRNLGRLRADHVESHLARHGGRKPIVIQSIFSPVERLARPEQRHARRLRRQRRRRRPLGGRANATGRRTTNGDNRRKRLRHLRRPARKGNYTLTPSAPGFVGENGKPPAKRRSA